LKERINGGVTLNEGVGLFGVALDEGVQRLVNHLLNLLGHARQVHVRLRGGSSLSSINPLRKVHRQIPGPLKIGHQLHGDGNEPQVGRHGLPAREDLQTHLVDGQLELVDVAIGLYHPLGQLGVTFDQRPHAPRTNRAPV
jgi:hypothetical protein